MVEKATDVAALTKLFSPSNASDAPRKRTTEAPRKNPLARPNSAFFGDITKEIRKTQSCLACRKHKNPENTEDDRNNRSHTKTVSQQYETQEGNLGSFSFGKRIANSKVPERKQPYQQKGEENLGQRSKDQKDPELCVQSRQGSFGIFNDSNQVKNRKRPCIKKSGGGCTNITQLPLEVFCRADRRFWKNAAAIVMGIQRGMEKKGTPGKS